MLPFDNRPWAKPVARAVIILSIIAAPIAAYLCYDAGELHIPETLIILLLLLTIIPPNVAIILRKAPSSDMATDAPGAMGHQPHLRAR